MILQTRQLSVRIGRHKVCLNLDLDLAAGNVLGILGRNGAGKSTLLATLAGLRPADSGQILLAGKSYAEHKPRAAARLRGWLGQHRDDPFASTVLETVLAGRHPHLGRWAWESAQDQDIARAALAELGLAGMEAREIHTLSGGERQRVAIATLFAQAPGLYLLDEPLTHLDLNHQIALLERLARRAREEQTAIAMVLHDPSLALRVCSHALLLFGDSRHTIGPAQDILNAHQLSSLYDHPLRRIENVFIPD